MTLSLQVQKAIDSMSTFKQGKDDEHIILQADKRVIGMLGTIVVTVAGAAFWSGVQLTQMKADISNATEAVVRTTAKQNEIIGLLTDVHESLDDLEQRDHDKDNRVTKLEEWRKMQTEWQEMTRKMNPELNVPPSPPTADEQ